MTLRPRSPPVDGIGRFSEAPANAWIGATPGLPLPVGQEHVSPCKCRGGQVALMKNQAC